MEFNNLPDFELDLELDETIQEKESSQEKTEEIVVNKEDDIEIEQDGDSDPETETDSNYGENSDPLAIQTFNQLKENGVIIEDPNNPFDGTWEKLSESLESLPQRVLGALVEQAPELSKQLIKFAFSSENITVDDFKQFAKVYLEEIENTTSDIETMDEARDYLESIYKERGMRPSAIRAALDALEEDDALIEEAKIESDKNKELKHKQTDAIIAQKQQEEIQKTESQRQFVSQISTELENTGWNKQRIERVKSIMSNNTLGELLNKTIASPKAIIKLADFLDYFDPKTGDIDYSKFMTKAETKQAKSFKDKVEQAINTPNTYTKSTLTNPNKDWDDLEPILN